VLLFGGVFGGGASGAGMAHQTVKFRAVGKAAATWSGDCASRDIVILAADGGEATGDVSGHMSGIGEWTAFAADRCESGFARTTYTISRTDGSQLSYMEEGPVDVTSTEGISRGAGDVGMRATIAERVTGGTGAYAGASGSGTCLTSLGGGLEAGGSFDGYWQSDCTLNLAFQESAQAVQ